MFIIIIIAMSVIPRLIKCILINLLATMPILSSTLFNRSTLSLCALPKQYRDRNSSESQLFGKYKKHQQRNRKVIQGRELAYLPSCEINNRSGNLWELLRCMLQKYPARWVRRELRYLYTHIAIYWLRAAPLTVKS